MKILFSYPPLDLAKGYPTLGQNRQFQYFNAPTFIYPVVPAIAATMLKNDGHQVIWNDCIAEGMDRTRYFEFIRREKPDLIVFESKTPVINEHWAFIDALKKELLTSNVSLLTVLTGDHVTALPEESFENSAVDFVLTGGDYDFLLLNLCRYLETKPSTIDHGQSTNLEPGIWRRENGRITNTGPFVLNHDLDRAPFIDRELTEWGLYAYENGNYRRTPGTYIMSGRDCWWGRCSFCSWTQIYPEFRSRSVDNVLDEIGCLTREFPIKEIMDDTGTFPRGDWLRDFCRGIVARGYHRSLGFDCNFRFGAAGLEEYRMMAKAGFRFLLFGVESGNQETLDRLNKGITVEEIIDSCRLARRAGLYPHVTIMFGYPWE
ncbi:MAG: radical SAM protein, partial [bacterium]